MAFVMDAVRTGVLDPERIWKTNVPGTARVMEAVTEANRDWPMVEKFIFLSSVSAYGPDLLQASCRRDSPRGAYLSVWRTEDGSRSRSATTGASLTGLHALTFCGRTFSPVPTWTTISWRRFAEFQGGAANARNACVKRRSAYPACLPSGKKYLENRIQFVHIDDVARLVAHILKKTDPEAQRLTVLNVAGRGTPLTYEQCVSIARAKLVRVPTERLFDLVLQFFWKMRISTIPPDIMPYVLSDNRDGYSAPAGVSGPRVQKRNQISDRGGVCRVLQMTY
jgi:nucleoside-diphosphate-sugar epimerase